MQKKTKKNAEKRKRGRRAEEQTCAVCSAVFSSMIKLKWHMYKEHRKSFACHLCERRYSHPKELERHIARFHEGQIPRSFACHLCERKYSLPANLKEHIARFHEGQMPQFQCSICGNRLTTKHSLQDHMRTHTGEEPFKCEFCYRTFARKNELRDHRKSHLGLQPPKPPRKIINRALIKRHPNPKQHACHLCGARYNHPRNVKRHIERDHELKRAKYGCSICGKWLAAVNNLMDHLDAHRGVRSHECQLCGESFSWLNSLREHLEKRHQINYQTLREIEAEGLPPISPFQLNARAFDCSRCESRHSSKHSLLLHLQSSHDVVVMTRSIYTCCQCSKMFAGPRRLMRHMNSMHLLVRKFTCNTCGMAFKASDHLKKHVSEVHERTKALGCALCPYRNFHKERIVSHLVTRHYAFDRLAPLAFSYKCETCDLGFFERRPFSYHAELHRSAAAWKCSECGIAYGSPEFLTRHLEAMHAYEDKQSKLYVCSRCGLRFGSAACLIEHASYHGNFMPHRCCACKAGYRTREELISHARKVHWPPAAAIPCLWCPKRLSVGERGEHMVHVLAHFGINKPNTRKPITRRYRKKDGFDFRSADCLTCQFPGSDGKRCGIEITAKTLTTVMSHVRAHSTHIQFRCPKCAYGNRRKRYMVENHIRRLHPGLKPNEVIDNGALSTRAELHQLVRQCFPEVALVPR